MAFKVRITKPNARVVRRNVRAAVDAGRSVAVNLIAQRLKAEVLKRIPKKDGWFKVYREALAIEIIPPATARIVGKTDTSLNSVPAANTAIFIEADNAVASVLGEYNPWPADMLPAIRGGVASPLRLVPSSKSEMNRLRTKLLEQMSAIDAKLIDAGARRLPDETPVYNGRVYFDFNFMANRLEYGIGPFKPSPHWKPAKMVVEAQADRIAKGIADAVERAMRWHL